LTVAAPDPVVPADIDNWLGLGGGIVTDQAAAAVVMSFGWIVGRTSFTQIPTANVPLDVWAAWLELASIGYDNPTMLTSNQAGEQITMWAGGAGSRIAQILATLEQNYPRSSQQPVGSFPSAFAGGPWPDGSDIVNMPFTPFGRHLPFGWWDTP
jgi:hypothetical protein